jgi:hypothetical protein
LVVRFRLQIGLVVNLGQCKRKNSYYYNVKTRLEIRFKSHVQVDMSQYKIKVVIIIALQLDLGISLGQCSGYGLVGQSKLT